jgi:hypothetical protein
MTVGTNPASILGTVRIAQHFIAQQVDISRGVTVLANYVSQKIRQTGIAELTVVAELLNLQLR